MGKKYNQLRREERSEISILLGRGCSIREIAKVMKRSPSTISREINKNRRRKRASGGTVKGKYEAIVAQQKAYVRRRRSKYQGKKITENKELKEYIVKMMV